jgi:hypothetical protein
VIRGPTQAGKAIFAQAAIFWGCAEKSSADNPLIFFFKVLNSYTKERINLEERRTKNE